MEKVTDLILKIVVVRHGVKMPQAPNSKLERSSKIQNSKTGWLSSEN